MTSNFPRFDSEIFRNDRRIIIARNRGQASILPVVLEYDANGYKAGQVIARNTTSGLWTKYVAAGSSGTDTAVGILLNDRLDLPASSVADGQLIIKGEVFESNCVDLDADAKVDLGARSVVSATGDTILVF
jgi:hypothetical protein